MATINVKDSAGSTVALEKPLTPGQSTMSASRPVTIASDQTDVPIKPGSTEVKVTAATIGTGGVGFIGWLSTIANYLAGTLTVATHAVTQSGTWTVQPGNTANTTAWKVDGSAVTQPASIADNSLVTLGAKADAKSTATDTTSVSAMSVFKQISASAQSLVTAIGSTAWDLGSGTAGSRTQRVIVDSSQFSALGAGAMTASQSVTIATDDARIGPVNETAPASDTASSGLNGRLQRIAQRITSMIALLPTALGQGTMSTSLKAVLPSDQTWPTGMSPRAFSAAFTTLTRPANTTAYTALDSISDNATAGSVTALTATVGDVNDDPLTLSEILITSTDTGLAGKRIRAYVFNSDPTASTGVGGGDNAAYNQKKAGYVGSFSGVLETGFSDGTVGRLVPSYADGAAASTPNAPAGGFVVTKPTSGAKTLFIQYQAVDGFTPSANSTTIIGTVRGFQGRAA